VRSRIVWAAVAVLGVAALGSSGCASGGGNSVAPTQQAAQEFTVSVDKEGSQSTGPAKEIDGARKGGNAIALTRDDNMDLDAARAYDSVSETVTELLARRLTIVKQAGDKKILVGDLATNAGETTDGGRTWKYTLKDGITFEDGTPITSKDVKYAVERSFHQKYTGIPTWIQQWLVGTANHWEAYPGPYEGKELGADKIDTPNDKTIVFTLADRHGDFPFAASIGTTAPVLRAHDTQDDYNKKPFSTGPYKIGSHEPDKSLVLVKNDKWVANTDPVRHQYVDQFTLSFGVSTDGVNDRLIPAVGDDQNAFALWQPVTAKYVQKIQDDPTLRQRVASGPGTSVSVYAINNTRITDKKVRQALNIAFPKEQTRQSEGGSSFGDIATTLGSPTNAGWAKYDLEGVTDVSPRGDTQRAKKLLADAGKPNQQIVFAYAQTPIQEAKTVAIKAGLEAAGFTVVTKPLPAKEYNKDIRKLANEYDLYLESWGADWPTASTVYNPLYYGKAIGDGGYNSSHYNNKDVDAEIERVLTIDDVVEQGKAFNELDKKILSDFPVVPYLYSRTSVLYGPKVGGAYLDPHSDIGLFNIYLKS
jgi:peptide/nickel transport system substrate-binding protein